MKTYDPSGDKRPDTTEAATAREAVLAWAEQQPRIRARATRATVSIHQTHLSYYQ